MHYITNNSSSRMYDDRTLGSSSPAEKCTDNTRNDYAQKVQQGVPGKKSCQFPVLTRILETGGASCLKAQNTQEAVRSDNIDALIDNISPLQDTNSSKEESVISSEISKKIAEEVKKLKTLLTQDNPDAILEHFAKMRSDFLNYKVIFHPKKTTPLRVVKSKQVMKELVTPNVIAGKSFIESILKINGLELENKIKLIQQLLSLQYLFNKKENRQFIKGCVDLNEIIKKHLNSIGDDLREHENETGKYNRRFYIASDLLNSCGVSGYNAKLLIDLSVPALKYYDDKVSISDEEFIKLNNFYRGILKKQAFFIKEIRNMLMPSIKQFLNTYSNHLSTIEKANWRESLTKILDDKYRISKLTKEFIKKYLLHFVSSEVLVQHPDEKKIKEALEDFDQILQMDKKTSNFSSAMPYECPSQGTKRPHDTRSDVVQNLKKAAYSNNGNVPIKSILPVEGNASTANQHATTSPNNGNLVQENQLKNHDIDAHGKEIIKYLEDFPNIADV